jgi:hypothetical protein
MDMDTQHGFGHAAWIWTMDMHGCRNADKKLCPSLAFRHHGQSGTASHQISLLVPSYAILLSSLESGIILDVQAKHNERQEISQRRNICCTLYIIFVYIHKFILGSVC